MFELKPGYDEYNNPIFIVLDASLPIAQFWNRALAEQYIEWRSS